MQDIATACIQVYLVAPFSRDTRNTCLTLHSDRNISLRISYAQYVLKIQPHQTRPLPFVQGRLGNQALPEGFKISTLEKQRKREKENSEKRPKHILKC